ncbi:MAG TPA: hypothetical protein VHU61_13615 [Solirubrobacteraceae bacterium]|jgi:hypothetical protein|nr:hypothetical protein [Solirubrobacteraceae bacterium]
MLRKASVLGALLATATAIAACGGSSPTKTTASTAAHKSQALKQAQCMRTHGVPDFPDPTNSGGFGIQASADGGTAAITVDGHTVNVSGPAFRRAMNDCAKYGPHGPAISGAQLAQIKQGALKMATCMRSHGVPNFPDPKVTSGPGGNGIAVRIGGPAGGGAGKLDPGSPAFTNAQKVCQKYMRVGPKAQAAGK